MNHTAFVVTRFINRNGSLSWRVSGNLHGVRVRKNFRSRVEAGAEKAALELKALQNASGLRASATFLTDDQLREAEASYRKFTDKPRSLSVYLDYALAHYREPDREVPLAVAVDEYVAAKQMDVERTLLSIRQFRSIRSELDLLRSHFPKASVAQLSPQQLVAYLERGRAALKIYNNRRGILSTLFNFAVQKDWLARNPIEKTPYHRISHRRGSAETLTAKDAAKLMVYVEEFKGGMVDVSAACSTKPLPDNSKRRNGDLCGTYDNGIVERAELVGDELRGRVTAQLVERMGEAIPARASRTSRGPGGHREKPGAGPA